MSEKREITEAEKVEIERRKQEYGKRLEKAASKGQLTIAGAGGSGRIPNDVPIEHAEEYRALRSERKTALEERSKLRDKAKTIGERMLALRGKAALLLALLIAPALAVFYPALSFAAEAVSTATATQGWWKVALAFLLQNALPILCAVLVALVSSLLSRWKISVELDLIQKAVSAGVGYAEQWAISKLKDGQKTTGAAKLAEALSFVQALLDKYNIRGWTEEKLKALIEGALGTAKISASSAAIVAAATATATVKDLKLPSWAGATK